MDLLVIINPKAGNTARSWPEMRECLRQKFNLDEYQTKARGEAVQLAAKAPDDYSGIVVVGGDGTFSEAARGSLSRTNPIPLGLLPTGTGNDFVKHLQSARPGQKPWFDRAKAIMDIMGMNIERFSVGEVRITRAEGDSRDETKIFLNSFTVGFGAWGASLFDRYVRHLHRSNLGYNLAALLAFLTFRTPRFQVRMDDGPARQMRSTMMALMLGRCYGGSFWLAPENHPQETKFQSILAKKLPRMNILSLIEKIKRGRHFGDPRLETPKVSSMTLETSTAKDRLLADLDGEVVSGATRLDIRMRPQCLPIFCGK